jgi:hypothetical protein
VIRLCNQTGGAGLKSGERLSSAHNLTLSALPAVFDSPKFGVSFSYLVFPEIIAAIRSTPMLPVENGFQE